MSKPKQFQPSNILLVEVLPQFIALCEASGASPQAALRGMAVSHPKGIDFERYLTRYPEAPCRSV
jgi:hypothetical protein